MDKMVVIRSCQHMAPPKLSKLTLLKPRLDFTFSFPLSQLLSISVTLTIKFIQQAYTNSFVPGTGNSGVNVTQYWTSSRRDRLEHRQQSARFMGTVSWQITMGEAVGT